MYRASPRHRGLRSFRHRRHLPPLLAGKVTSILGESGNFCEHAGKVLLVVNTATPQPPQWNFHKYLVARDGNSVASFGSDVEPESAPFVAKLEELLRAR